MSINLHDRTGGRGTEGGVVLKDEELGGSCRITLEKCRMYYAVTCGVYGLMVHTAFFGQPEYEQKYAEMKRELASFVARMDSMTEDERSDFYGQFCDKY